MSNEGKLEGQAGDETRKPDQGEDTPTPTKSISVQDILNNYPIDREKCRDVLMMEMSQNLVRIANSLEAITQGFIVVNTHLSQISKK